MAYYKAKTEVDVAQFADACVTEENRNKLNLEKIPPEGFVIPSNMFNTGHYRVCDECTEKINALTILKTLRVEMELRMIYADSIEEVPNAIRAHLQINKVGSYFRNLRIISIEEQKE